MMLYIWTQNRGATRISQACLRGCIQHTAVDGAEEHKYLKTIAMSTITVSIITFAF